MNYPSISIISNLYNPEYSVFELMLKSVKDQKYPQKKIEHIVMDGGSDSRFVSLAKSYGASVHVHSQLRNDALKRARMAIFLAKNDLILFLEPDNILIGRDWLSEMVRPFNDDSKVIGTFSMYNTAYSSMPALTRYTSLIGVNDPTVYYLGKSEKLPQFESEYKKGTPISGSTLYITMEFNPQNLPVLGDNGHMVRRKKIIPVVKSMETFLHTDAFMLLCRKGYKRYGIVKNSIIHYTGSNVIDFFVRRITYKKRYAGTKAAQREYKVFDNRNASDRKHVLLFIFFSLTVIEPLYVSFKGFIRKRDIAWFLHPIMCILAVLAYGLSEFSGSNGK